MGCTASPGIKPVRSSGLVIDHLLVISQPRSDDVAARHRDARNGSSPALMSTPAWEQQRSFAEMIENDIHDKGNGNTNNASRCYSITNKEQENARHEQDG